ncbi:MAG: ATP-binding protein [Anaerolineae bacterium]
MGSSVGMRARELGALDLDDLVERTLLPMALLLAVVAVSSAVFYLPGEVFRWQQFLLLATVAAVASLALLLRRSNPAAGTVVLVLGLSLVAVPAATWLPGSASFFLSLAMVAARAAPWPLASLITGIGAALLHLAVHNFLRPQPYPDLAALTYCLMGGMLFFSANPSRVILHWSWRRHADALKLAEELRDRQGQLNRTIKALDLAYRLLQSTNHELAEARQEADEARQLKERFTANISHELRTPLNLILGFSEMMYVSPQIYGEVNWTKPLRRDVARIYEASRHLSQLVDDVLDLSRVQGEHMPLRKELCDLEEILRDAVATVEGLLRTRPLTIRLQIEAQIPRLLLDGTRIRQVVINLLNNAIRFTDQGEIVLAAALHESDVLVSVRDTGAGIAEHELGSIFDEFYQAEAAVRKGSGGMGLGLAISKRFVQLHGGRIWAESKLGEGSTFFFTIPIDDTHAPTSRLRISQPLPAPESPYSDCVLLLNGQRDVARLLERHLGNYRVVSLGNGGEARQLLNELHPKAAVYNLSLSDMKTVVSSLLPGDALDELPLIFCSIPCASWRTEMLGAYGSLQKPIQRQELLSLLDGLEGAGDILIIDDDRDFVQMLVRMLTGASDKYRVRWAHSGADGLAAMREHLPDVALLDLLMPEMAGADVVAAMRADQALSTVPVIILTAADVEEDLASVQTRVVGLVQTEGWSLGDTLRALNELIAQVSSRHVMPDAEMQACPEGLPG